MNWKTASGLALILLLLVASIPVFNTPSVKGSSSIPIRRFRLLLIEQFLIAPDFIGELLSYPNWNNSTDQCISYIHFLSVYNYSEIDDIVKPFWRGDISVSNLRNEFTNFLGEAAPGEIVVFCFYGHHRLAEWILVLMKFIEDLKSVVTQGAFLTVILDTCSAGEFVDHHFRELIPESIVLASTGYLWALTDAFYFADDFHYDGWISAIEAFSFIEFALQDPYTRIYYGTLEGDLPLVQRDETKPFPTWDTAIVSMRANAPKVEPGFPLEISVIIENQGVKLATVDVSVRSNSTLISTQRINLTPGEVKNIDFAWFPTEIYGLYMLGSMVSMSPGEIDISDNIYYGPQVIVALEEDLNLDKLVDIEDVVTASLAFGSYPDHPRWNLIADINQDGIVDIEDVVIIAINFGKTA